MISSKVQQHFHFQHFAQDSVVCNIQNFPIPITPNQTWNSIYFFREPNSAIYRFPQNRQYYSSTQGKMAIQMAICGNDATFCEKLSQNLLTQPTFEEFHKSFHNPTDRQPELHAPPLPD